MSCRICRPPSHRLNLSLQHLLANLAGCAALALLGWAASLPRRAAGAWLAAWPLTQLGLWLRPDLLHYGGLSGVLHAGVAVLCVQLWLRGGRERRIGIALLLGLTGKLLLEAPWGPALQAHEGWDIAITPFAHLSGAVAGLLCAAVGLRRARNTACPDVFTSKQGASRPPN